jgi:hypothetical protein
MRVLNRTVDSVSSQRLCRLSEKARKAEFTGAHKQALEQHNEALCLLKLDRVDDRLQTTHIRIRERNIVKFG